jgi:uncharacterized protein (TIGR02466 family)
MLAQLRASSPRIAAMLDIVPAFAVPMGFARRPDDGLDAELKALFLAREADGERWRNPNPYTLRNAALYESRFDLFDWPDPPIQRLKRYCWQMTMELVRQLNGYDLATMRRIDMAADAWFHVTRRGGLFGIHNHPMASWSGVYCVDGGEHDPGDEQSGLLTFINPFVMSTMFVDAGTAALREPFAWTSRSHRLEAGQLVLFPSWVLHEVKPFHGEGTRITVAFNAWFHLRPE